MTDFRPHSPTEVRFSFSKLRRRNRQVPHEHRTRQTGHERYSQRPRTPLYRIDIWLTRPGNAQNAWQIAIALVDLELRLHLLF